MKNMKLKDMIPETLNRIDKYIIADKFKIFLEEGKENHWYVKDFDRWAASVLRDAIYKPSEICDMYHQYNCNDDHIYTLIHHCMKIKGFI